MIMPQSDDCHCEASFPCRLHGDPFIDSVDNRLKG